MYLQDVKKIIKKLFFSDSNRSVRRWCVAALEVHVLPLQQLPLTSTHLNTFGRGAGPDGQTTGRALWTPTHTHTHTHTRTRTKTHTHTKNNMATWLYYRLLGARTHARVHTILHAHCPKPCTPVKANWRPRRGQKAHMSTCDTGRAAPRDTWSFAPAERGYGWCYRVCRTLGYLRHKNKSHTQLLSSLTQGPCAPCCLCAML